MIFTAYLLHEEVMSERLYVSAKWMGNEDAS